MAWPKTLLQTALMREIISIRIDSLWRMLDLRRRGQLPGRDEEGATGQFDNKGALFLPGGLVYADSDGNPIEPERWNSISEVEFRRRVREAMRLDNAILLYPDGMAVGVNLDNGYFAEMARNLLATKQAALKRSPVLNPNPPHKIGSDEITRSNAPLYIEPPYGSRTRLSACASVCLTEPRLYYIACRAEFGLRNPNEQERVWREIRDARRPVLGRNKAVLAGPYVVVCHATRHRERALGGLTRILGIGRFGAFATVTLEVANSALLNEVGLHAESDISEFVMAEYEKDQVLCILRLFKETKPGKRPRGTETHLVHPVQDLLLDTEDIAKEARKRYEI